MYHSARRRLPPVDYVSVVKSLYADARSMLYGMICAAIAAAVSAMHSGSELLYVISGLFLIVGIARYVDMQAFDAEALSADDVETAARWESRITVGAVAVAAMHGFWCFFSLAVVDDGFAAYASTLVTIAGATGIVNRNFAVDRLVTLQLLFITIPLGAGLFMRADLSHSVIAVLLLLFMSGMRRMASRLRDILLGAVHGRVEADRLAGELDTAMATMPHGLCMLDEEGRVAVVNAQAYAMFPGLAPARSLGRPLHQVLLDARRDGLLSATLAKQLARALAKGREHRKIVVALPHKVQCEITVSTREGHSVLMFEDISERVRASERINYMARYDGLTTLPNRNYFSEEVTAELARKQENKSRESVCLMMIDIDDFKHVNDTFGHPVGDALLVEAAKRVRAVIEPRGMVARFGGDEFTVFRSRGVNKRSVSRDATQILAALSQPFYVMGHSLKAHASVGIVVAPPTEDLATFLKRADLALYQAKGNGKAQWALFHDEMDVEYRHRQRLKTDLREAISNGELSLVFQPIVDLKTRRIIGCEALARWHHQELGRIPPTVFIPIAEEIGAISDLSRWVLTTATRECAHWPDPVRISVNLSATDFRTTDVAEMVSDALIDSGLPPNRLEIEITESTLIEEKDAVVRALGELRRHGVGIALDDFGTGYSSLSYLHVLPFTKLKIDRSFVVDVTTNPKSQKLLSNIAKLASDLEMIVTVEGIETEDQLDAIIRSTDIEQAQGFLFGMPLPKREITELISRVITKKVVPVEAARRKA